MADARIGGKQVEMALTYLGPNRSHGSLVVDSDTEAMTAGKNTTAPSRNSGPPTGC